MLFTQKLRTFSAAGLSIDELVELGAVARVLRSEYESRQLPVPEWLDDAARRVAREVESRVANRKAMRAQEIRAELASMESRDDRRSRLSQELAALEGQPA